MKIKVQKGSATNPKPSHKIGVIIAHLTNNIGAWGKGFVLAIDELSPAPKIAYKTYIKKCKNNSPLAKIQMIEIEPNLWIANMIAQKGINKPETPKHCCVDYYALEECLKLVFRRAVLLQSYVYMPEGIGSGLAGGNKTLIHNMIKTIANEQSIKELEQKMKFVPEIILVKFNDKSAKSYVHNDQNLFTKTGIDLSEDDI